MDSTQAEKVRSDRGFFAALDQSGGSTPKALREYGVEESEYSSEDEMYDLVHQMRTRIITNPAFTGDRVIGTILFEQTMDRQMDGVPTPQYLWQTKHSVPFVKVDKGLAEEKDNAQLMKPMPELGALLERARGLGVFGTKMRSVVKTADKAGIEAIADQQFEVGRQISDAGLVPILEPEVSITSPSKDEAEALLDEALRARLADWPQDRAIMFKLSIPTQVHRYADLAGDSRVLRVLALSGGYDRDEACALLAKDDSMIASFSRALLQGLNAKQSEQEFTAALDESIAQIYAASAH